MGASGSSLHERVTRRHSHQDLKTFLMGLHGEETDHTATVWRRWESDGQLRTDMVNKSEDRPPSPVPSPQQRRPSPPPPDDPTPDSRGPSPRPDSPSARLRTLCRRWSVPALLRAPVEATPDVDLSSDGGWTSREESRSARHRPMEARGIRWDQLRDRLSTYAANAAWTTKDVVDRAIRPVTMTLACAYYELLLPQTGCIGKPDLMVSHVWSQPFQLFVDTVGRYAHAFMDTHGRWPYVLVDFVCLNQHRLEFGCTATAVKRRELMDLLDEMLLASGALLVCIHPWDRPLVFTRVWCIFEMARCLHWKLPVVMTLPDHDVRALRQRFGRHRQGCCDDLMNVLQTIDVRNATASVPTDRTAILKHIQRTTGLQSVNHCVRMAVARHVCTTSRTTATPTPSVIPPRTPLAPARAPSPLTLQRSTWQIETRRTDTVETWVCL